MVRPIQATPRVSGKDAERIFGRMRLDYVMTEEEKKFQEERPQRLADARRLFKKVDSIEGLK